MSTQQGIITTDFNAGKDEARAVILQSDGKIVVVGYATTNGTVKFGLVRYNSNGSLDSSFDGDGIVTTTIGSGEDVANSVVIQPDGKLVAAGYSDNGSNNDFTLARYNADGSLDSSFDGDGIVTTDVAVAVGSFGENSANSVIIQPDGKLVAAGESQYGPPYQFALVRYNADGSLDTSFRYTGTVTTRVHGYRDVATSVVIQPDGKLVAAGYSDPIGFGSDRDYDFALVRYNADGKLDSSFNYEGIVTTAISSGKDVANSVVIQPDGKLVVAGYSDSNNDFTFNDFTLVRYNSNGSLDTTFDGDGIVTTAVVGSSGANSVILQPDGKLVAAGYSHNGSDHDFALARYNPDGSLDSSFDGDGIVTTAIGSGGDVVLLGEDVANSVVIQPDGKLVVAGTSYNGSNYDFALVRYNSNGSLDTTFDGITVSNHPSTGVVTIDDTTPETNQILSVSDTLADLDGLGTIGYTWKAGTTVTATGNTYTVTTNDVGKTIQVTASYTDGLGHPESVSSLVTSPVSPAPVNSYGVSVSSNGDLTTDEGGDTAVFSVKLTAAPVRDVSFFFSSLDTSEGAVSNPSLTFTSANWSTPQTFTVTGQDDTVADGNIAYQIKGMVNSIDVHYFDVAIDLISLINNDNEVAGETIYGDVGGSKADVLVGTNGDDRIFGLTMKDDLSGGAGDDELWGGYDNDVLFGEAGNDKLYGEQNNDYLDGGAGNDSLDGSLGLDTLIGGAGNDTYYLSYDVVDVVDDQGLATDIDTVIMPYQLSKYTLPKGIEKGTIAAGTQASSLTGNGSNNTLTGNDGKNTLNGAVGRDSLFGGVGDDVLNGGSGNDMLTGDTGKDNFVFNAALKSNVDKITDFKPVDDTIKLENQIFTKLTVTGVLNASQFVNGTAALDPNDYVIYNPATGAVTYDSDGSGIGQGVQIVQLGVNLALTNADFVVI
ncbi:MAG: hypothetical protein K9L25_13345 [Methylovulum sp.]|nr:hypothetical protein [Methylovulum sp.]